MQRASAVHAELRIVVVAFGSAPGTPKRFCRPPDAAESHLGSDDAGGNGEDAPHAVSGTGASRLERRTQRPGQSFRITAPNDNARRFVPVGAGLNCPGDV